MKKLKQWFKQLFCLHEYTLPTGACGPIPASMIRCKKCGKYKYRV